MALYPCVAEAEVKFIIHLGIFGNGSVTDSYGTWHELVERLAVWRLHLQFSFDNISSTINARRHGFYDCIDTEDMFTQFFDDMRSRLILPPLD